MPATSMTSGALSATERALYVKILDTPGNDPALFDLAGQLQIQALGLLAGVLAPLLWGSTLTLACGMGGMMFLGATAAWLHSRRPAHQP